MKICESIQFDIFGQEVIFIQGYKSLKEVLKEFDRESRIYKEVKKGLRDYNELVKQCNGWVTTITRDNQMLPILVVSEPIDMNCPRSLSILAHELIHVLQRIRGKFFPKFAQGKEIEFEAYIFEFLFEKILGFVKQAK